MSLHDQALAALEAIDAAGLRRTPRTITTAQGPYFEIDGRRILSFCSNDYLGFAAHPRLLDAARASLEVDGIGAAASRLVSGTMTAHREAEARLATFMGTADAVLFSTGYAANVGTVSGLAQKEDVLFCDALNHASLIDGCRLSRAKVHVYEHADPQHLHSLLKSRRSEGKRAFIVSDSVFSMDGDEAPVADLRRLADAYDAALVLDEAHAIGVLGPRGRGLAEELGVAADVKIGTLGKSFGAAGAFAAGSAPIMDLLRHRARSYVFSTAPMPVLARVATAAADLVEGADAARAQLASVVARLRRALQVQGYVVPEGRTPIIPVLVGDEARTMALSAALFEAGVLAQGIRPPTVPRGTSRIRIVPTAAHGPAELELAIAAFASARGAL